MSKVLFVHVDVADPISGPPLYGDWFAFIRPEGYIAVCVYIAGTLCLWVFTKCAAETRHRFLLLVLPSTTVLFDPRNPRHVVFRIAPRTLTGADESNRWGTKQANAEMQKGLERGSYAPTHDILPALGWKVVMFLEPQTASLCG